MITALQSRFFGKDDQLVVIVLGAHTTKAIHVRKDGDRLALLNYLLAKRPADSAEARVDALTQHLKNIKNDLRAETSQCLLVIGMGDALLRTVKMPSVSPAEMRRLLKLNPKHFFQQEFLDHQYDCFVLPQASAQATASSHSARPEKCVLVGGARAALVQALEAAAREAQWKLVGIALSQVGLAGAASLALPKELAGQAVALVDLGFRNSTITLVGNGEVGLTRVVAMGGEGVTHSLAKALNVPFQVAEGLETLMPEKVQAQLEVIITPLAQELKEALDFFESQEEKHVTTLLVSGGLARSDVITQGLEKRTGVPCRKWDASAGVNVALPAEKIDSLAKEAPQLSAAIGAAAAYFRPDLVQVNLLAEKIEEQQMHRRDPVRKALLGAGVAVLSVFAYAGQQALEIWVKNSEVNRAKAEMIELDPIVNEVAAKSKKTEEISQTLRQLDYLATNRFLWTGALSSLQYAMVDDVQMVWLKMTDAIQDVPGSERVVKANGTVIPAKPPVTYGTVTLTLKAKDFGQAKGVDELIDAIEAEPYYAARIRKSSPVVLKERMAPQIDPLNPSRSFVLFTVECVFATRTL